MSTVQPVTDETFAQTVLNSSRPVVVDFWADWCAPCKQLGPILDTMSKDMAGQVDFVKMDTNANTTIPARYGVLRLPTVLVFVDGQVVKQFTGAVPKLQFRKALDELL